MNLYAAVRSFSHPRNILQRSQKCVISVVCDKTAPVSLLEWVWLKKITKIESKKSIGPKI